MPADAAGVGNVLRIAGCKRFFLYDATNMFKDAEHSGKVSELPS